MEIAKEIQKLNLPTWARTLGSLLPLWLLSLAISVEGFPRPPISPEIAIASFVTAILVSIVLLWKRLVTIEFIVYSLFPFLLLPAFDEITTSYKTPFIFTCTLILTVGVIGYQQVRLSRLQKWLVLLAVAIVTLFAAAHAVNSFWQMAGELGYVECFPDYHGCAPLTGQEPPWWVLFFSI